MATIFLQIPGINGDVTAEGFKQQIAISACGHASSRSIRSAANSDKNRESSTVNVSEFSFRKNIDPASNPMWLKAFSDGVVGDCIVSFVRTSDGGEAYRTMTLTDCIITSLQCSSPSGAQRPLEFCTLNFTTISETYKTTDKTNADGTSATTGYDLGGGKPI